MKLTAYNHYEIEENGKPLIKNGQFKELCNLISQTKDEKILKEYMIKYSFVPEQKRLLNSLINPL